MPSTRSGSRRETRSRPARPDHAERVRCGSRVLLGSRISDEIAGLGRVDTDAAQEAFLHPHRDLLAFESVALDAQLAARDHVVTTRGAAAEDLLEDVAGIGVAVGRAHGNMQGLLVGPHRKRKSATSATMSG